MKLLRANVTRTKAIAIVIACMTASGQQAGYLHEEALKARAAGKDAITIHPRTNSDGADDSLQRTMTLLTFQLAVPVTALTVVGKSTIATWYKFRIIEPISTAAKCQDCSDPFFPPSALMPIGRDEEVIRLVGGTGTVDGVRVTVEGAYPSKLLIGRPYLLLVDPNSDGTAALVAGEAGIYGIGADDSLNSLGGGSYRLKTEILRLKTLSGLRAAITSSRNR